MTKDADPIKDRLFEYIDSSSTLPALIAEKRFDAVIDNVIENCYELTDHKDEAIGTLATGLLHYLLTCALIPSQRKVELDGINIDIIIPDIRTLKRDPKLALIICIPKSSDPETLSQKISELESIQPERDNIWTILSRDGIQTGMRSFVLSRHNGSFSGIISEIARFSKTDKLKILGI